MIGRRRPEWLSEETDMIKNTEYYSSADGVTDIYVAVWSPDDDPVAVLQIVHGMV